MYCESSASANPVMPRPFNGGQVRYRHLEPGCVRLDLYALGTVPGPHPLIFEEDINGN